MNYYVYIHASSDLCSGWLSKNNESVIANTHFLTNAAKFKTKEEAVSAAKSALKYTYDFLNDWEKKQNESKFCGKNDTSSVAADEEMKRYEYFVFEECDVSEKSESHCLKNSERYITVKERAKAFDEWCDRHNRVANHLLLLEWLDMDVEEEPLPCPFCGSDTVLNESNHIFFVECLNDHCNYQAKDCSDADTAILLHNRVARAAKMLKVISSSTKQA